VLLQWQEFATRLVVVFFDMPPPVPTANVGRC